MNYKNTMEVNNKLNLNVDEQQDAINHLKEQCDIDDEEKHIHEQHTDLWWNYGDYTFWNFKEVNKYRYEACESTCHECTSKDEVENDKEDIELKMDELITKKDFGNKEIMREKKMKISSP